MITRNFPALRKPRPSYTRLRLLVNPHGYLVGYSESDNLKIAVISEFEYFFNLVLPWNIYPNAMQAYRAIKRKLAGIL